MSTPTTTDESIVSSFVSTMWKPTRDFDPEKHQYHQLAFSWPNQNLKSFEILWGPKDVYPLDDLGLEFDLCIDTPGSLSFDKILINEDKPSVITTKDTPENKAKIESALCKIAHILGIERSQITTYDVGPFGYNPDNYGASNEEPYGMVRTSKCPIKYFKPHFQEIIQIDCLKWNELEIFREEIQDKYDIFIDYPCERFWGRPGTIYFPRRDDGSEDSEYVYTVIKDIGERLGLSVWSKDFYEDFRTSPLMDPVETCILYYEGCGLGYNPNEVWTDYGDEPSDGQEWDSDDDLACNDENY